MKATRIRFGTRKAAPAAAVRASSNTANGKFADHLKILHSRLRERGEKGDSIGLASGANAAVLEDLSRSLGSVTVSAHPRTFKLLQSGRRKLARKVSGLRAIAAVRLR